MAGYENLSRYGDPLYTSTTMGATGASTLVGAPTAGIAIAIDHVKILITTDTSGLVDAYFSPAATASSIGRVYTNRTATSANTGLALEKTYDPPVIIGTATALQVMVTISAASTPGASFEVGYRLLTR